MTDHTALFPCPKGHDSTEADYCSECGAKLGAVSPVEAAVPCPDCGTARYKDAHYCHACGHDYHAARAAIPAVPAEPVEPAAPLWVAVQVDRSSGGEANPHGPHPDDRMGELFPLERDETLVGRMSHARHSDADISIADPGISRRHLAFLRDGDGRFAVCDLNSTNGTRLNGVALAAGVEVSIKPGDHLTIGEWTRLAVRAL